MLVKDQSVKDKGILKKDMEEKSDLHEKLLQFGPWPATKDHKVALSPVPPLAWGGEWKEKCKKLVGQDKGILTEQQTKRTVRTTILRRRIYKINNEMHGASLTAPRSQAATAFPPASSPTRTQHDGPWYRIPCFVSPVWVSPPGCVPSWLLVKY